METAELQVELTRMYRTLRQFRRETSQVVDHVQSLTKTCHDKERELEAANEQHERTAGMLAVAEKLVTAQAAELTIAQVIVTGQTKQLAARQAKLDETIRRLQTKQAELDAEKTQRELEWKGNGGWPLSWSLRGRRHKVSGDQGTRKLRSRLHPKT